MVFKLKHFSLLLLASMLCFSLAAIAEERPTHRFDRAWLENTAKELSEKEYIEKKIEEGSALRQLNYDDYKKIQFERSATIWAKEDRNFRLIPLHPGFLFTTPVKLNLVVAGVSRRILYTTDIYQYDKELLPAKQTQSEGYSGFSVTTPINTDTKWDEFLVFQGGTYFRSVGEGNWYGLSARGLAINTAKPEGEEFPVFTDFWIQRPTTGSDKLVVHALMDSKSVTGAFTFTVTPGENTEIRVKSKLFPRRDIASFGLGALTSMFLFDGLDSTKFDDFRPAVHDSDGLFMITNKNERIWRPLANPRRLQASIFKDISPKGFGLLQRKRTFSKFEDMEANYEARPSAWIEPVGDWGAGHVELIEIPTNAEIHDNIVAFWQPEKTMKANEAYEFEYKIKWGNTVDAEKEDGRITSSLAGLSLNSPDVREFVIDYEGENIPNNLTIHASASAGKIVGTVGKFMQKTGQYRVIVKFDADDEDLSELRVSLSSNDKQWGETWLYKWTN